MYIKRGLLKDFSLQICILDVFWLGPPAPKVLGSDENYQSLAKNTSRMQMLLHRMLSYKAGSRAVDQRFDVDAPKQLCFEELDVRNRDAVQARLN